MLVSSHYLLTGLFFLLSLNAYMLSCPTSEPLLYKQSLCLENKWLPHLVFEFLSQRKVGLYFECWPGIWEPTTFWVGMVSKLPNIRGKEAWLTLPQRTRSGWLGRSQYHKRKVCILGFGRCFKGLLTDKVITILFFRVTDLFIYHSSLPFSQPIAPSIYLIAWNGEGLLH